MPEIEMYTCANCEKLIPEPEIHEFRFVTDGNAHDGDTEWETYIVCDEDCEAELRDQLKDEAHRQRVGDHAYFGVSPRDFL